MLLLKEFLRKSKTKEYIKIFVLLFCTMFVLNGISTYSNKAYDDYEKSITSIIIEANKNIDTILDKEKNIKSYQRALTFTEGEDNDIIYEYPIRVDEYGNVETIEELIDNTKLEWGNLRTSNGKILAFPSFICNIELEANEVVLAMRKNKDYDESLKDNYIDKKITFNHDNENQSLYTKDIIPSKTYNYICVSEKKYNKLLNKEKEYIYDIELINYRKIDKLSSKLKKINGYEIKFSIHKDYQNMSNQNNENLSRILNVLNFIATLIFFIIIVFTTKDLISDEEQNIILLKQIGYTKIQNILNSIKNMLVFNTIVLIISIILSLLIIILLNLFLEISIQLFNFQYYLIICLLVTLIEILYINNISR